MQKLQEYGASQQSTRAVRECAYLKALKENAGSRRLRHLLLLPHQVCSIQGRVLVVLLLLL